MNPALAATLQNIADLRADFTAIGARPMPRPRRTKEFPC